MYIYWSKVIPLYVCREMLHEIYTIILLLLKSLKIESRTNSNKTVSISVSEPFFVQKTDLIAELKRTKDIPGIKKLKVERAQVEKTQEQNLMSEISKAFSVTNFVDQVRAFYLSLFLKSTHTIIYKKF